MNKKQVIAILKQSHLFGEVAEKGLETIAENIKENFYEKGGIIFSEGENGDTLHIIAKGSVKIIKYTREGRTKTLAVLKERESFGEMALLTKEARSATVEALEKTMTLSITREKFEHMINSEPSISLQIIKTLCHRLARADRDIKNLALGDAKTRVACVLVDFSCENSEVKLTHQEIADMAGLTRETITRTLKQMAGDGAITTSNRKISITDMSRLKSYCS
ncbi:MAG TPA: Crp/Fnr family transcriptional regulator [Candidatus Goldiibacteriota bacterium]|nr:Crp/Fnr family transcriptional regulator [Candidatus Goldiibacteriota bacterium]